jgi:hypothetical protein
VGDRDAGEGTGRSFGQARIRSLRLGQRQPGVDVQEGVMAARRNTVEIMLGELGRRDLLGMQERGQLLDGFLVHHD